MPHWELLLGIATIRFAGLRVPCPDFVGIEKIQFLRQSTGGKFLKIASKISIDVVGVTFIFYERPVGVSPEFLHSRVAASEPQSYRSAKFAKLYPMCLDRLCSGLRAPISICATQQMRLHNLLVARVHRLERPESLAAPTMPKNKQYSHT